MPSWEEMCQQVVVAGRPGDVATAASLWEQLLKNVNTVKESLETNVKDLGEVWKGEGYEAFKTHITGIATEADRLVTEAEGQSGIVQSLRTAADDLSAAQARFPIPASCVNDVLEARNGRLVIDTGFFEMKVKPDFLGLLDPLSSLADWINDKSGEAAEVYGDVSGKYLETDQGMPGTVGPGIDRQPTPQMPDLGTGPGGTGPGGAPSMGGMPSTGGLPGSGPSANLDKLPGTGTMPGTGSGAHPDLGGAYPGSGGSPGTGSLADGYGSGLAGAAPTTTAPGLGGGGLPGTSGLGASGGGAGLAGGGGMIPGGGSLGRPVTPGMAPMMGGGMAGAGRGGGRGAGGRLGAGGKLGAGGGMAPMMGGGMAGAGRGAGGRGAGRGAAGVGGAGVAGAGRGAGAAGARGGIAGMGGTGGAGYGDEEVPRNTWLEEDEDVWGADGGGAPGVLR